MEPFTLRKVVNPHVNMPEEIKKAFFDGVRDYDMPNNSYIDWKVGSYQIIDEDYNTFPEDTLLEKVDDWLLENGFDKNESIMILHWW